MEIIVTLFIIAIFASLLLYALIGASKDMKILTCRTEMTNISSAVQAYYHSISDVAPNAEIDFDVDIVDSGLLKREAVLDVWGQEYKILYQGLGGGKTLISQVILQANKATSIYSSGPDKEWESKDDLEYVFIIEPGN